MNKVKKTLCIILALVIVLSPCAFASEKYASKDYFDFSDMNLHRESAKQSDYSSEGGSWDYALSYFTSWQGPLAEKDDPYGAKDYNGNSTAVAHVSEGEFINLFDTDDIKQAVIDYGALYVAFTVNWGMFTDDDMYYYHPEINYYKYMIDALFNTESGGHAVCIVGYDDSIPASEFKYTPPGDGAFICKNSWGDDWGDNGYFYLSYYDNAFSDGYLTPYIGSSKIDSACAFRLSDEEDYNKIYQYDPFGCGDEVYYLYDYIDFTANIFPEKGKVLEKDELLEAVSFYTFEDNVKYKIHVYTDCDNEEDLTRFYTENLAPVASGSIEKAGYHTVNLKRPVTVRAGERFAVAVSLIDKDDYPTYYAEEKPFYGVSGAQALANHGESFYGAAGKVFDINNEDENTNFCIKAFTKCEVTEDGPYTIDAIDNFHRDYESVTAVTGDGEKSGKASASSAPGMPAGKASAQAVTSLPPSFDSRVEGNVSPIRDQGDLGSCWAFSCISALETYAFRMYENGNGIFDGCDGYVIFPGCSGSFGVPYEQGKDGDVSFTASEAGKYTFAFENCDYLTRYSPFGVGLYRNVNENACVDLDEGETVYFRAGAFDGSSGEATITIAGYEAPSEQGSDDSGNSGDDYDVLSTLATIFSNFSAASPIYLYKNESDFAQVFSTRLVRFVSDNEDIARVSALGRVTAVNEGATKIYTYNMSGEMLSCFAVYVLPERSFGEKIRDAADFGAYFEALRYEIEYSIGLIIAAIKEFFR